MNEIEEIIEQSLTLCKRLDELSYLDKKFCVDLCAKLEVWSWDILNIAQSLKNYNQEER